MHVGLAPGETLRPGTRDDLDRLFVDPRVEAVLLPLVPEGDGAFPRAARRHLAAWDARFLHPQTFFAPASRVASREPRSGWRNADAAPFLADVLARGGRVEALRTGGVATPVGADLQAWLAWAADEGRAWGALAAKDPRFRPYLPALTWGGWTRHNLLQMPRRVVEILQAAKGPRPGAWLLHASREAAWTAGCVRGFREG